MYDINELKAKKLPELKEVAEKLNLKKFKSLNKQELVYLILDHQAANPGAMKTEKPSTPSDKKPQEAQAEKATDTRAPQNAEKKKPWRQ